AALNYAKNLTTISSEDSQDFEQNELDINWLALDNDTPSIIESMWTSTTDDNHVIDYELGETNINLNSSQCVVVDYIEGHLQRCPNSVCKPIKQLIGIWELSFEAVDIEVDQDQQLQAILLEEIWLAIFKFFDRKSNLSKNSIDNEDVDQTFKAKPLTYFGIKAAL
ncbi:6343_t:CDS:2, partial [Dentiscutata heterogama]